MEFETPQYNDREKAADRLDREMFLKVIYALLMISGALLVYNYFSMG